MLWIEQGAREKAEEETGEQDAAEAALHSWYVRFDCSKIC